MIALPLALVLSATLASSGVDGGVSAEPQPIPAGFAALPEVRHLLAAKRAVRQSFQELEGSGKLVIAITVAPFTSGTTHVFVSDFAGHLDPATTNRVEDCALALPTSGNEGLGVFTLTGHRGLAVGYISGSGCLVRFDGKTRRFSVQRASGSMAATWAEFVSSRPRTASAVAAELAAVRALKASPEYLRAFPPAEAVGASLDIPGSPFVLVVVDVLPDEPDEMPFRAFIYDPRTRQIDRTRTDSLDAQLLRLTDCTPAQRATLSASRDSVQLLVDPVPPSARTEVAPCPLRVLYDAASEKIYVVEEADDGSEEMVTAFRPQLQQNDEALRLWATGKRVEALAMWEALEKTEIVQRELASEVCNNLGFAYDRLGRANEAIAVLRRCALSDPTRGTVEINLAEAYRDAKDPARAIAHFERALEMELTDAQRRHAEAELKKLPPVP